MLKHGLFRIQRRSKRPHGATGLQDVNFSLSGTRTTSLAFSSEARLGVGQVPLESSNFPATIQTAAATATTRKENSAPGCKRSVSGWTKPVVPLCLPSLNRASRPFLAWQFPKPYPSLTATATAFKSSISSAPINGELNAVVHKRKEEEEQEEEEQDDDSLTDIPSASSIFENASNKKLNLLLHVDMDDLREMASKRCTPLSLKDMYKYAVKDVNNPEQRLWNAQFLHKE
jgi:hypothetical protein